MLESIASQYLYFDDEYQQIQVLTLNQFPVVPRYQDKLHLVNRALQLHFEEQLLILSYCHTYHLDEFGLLALIHYHNHAHYFQMRSN